MPIFQMRKVRHREAMSLFQRDTTRKRHGSRVHEPYCYATHILSLITVNFLRAQTQCSSCFYHLTPPRLTHLLSTYYC